MSVTYKPKGSTLQPCMWGLTSDLQFQSHFGPPPVPISRDPSRAWGWETEGGQVTSGRCRVNHSLLWRAATTASCEAWGRQHSSSGSPSWLSTVAASLWRPCGEEGRERWGASLMVHSIIPCIGHPPPICSSQSFWASEYLMLPEYNQNINQHIIWSSHLSWLPEPFSVGKGNFRLTNASESRLEMISKENSYALFYRGPSDSSCAHWVLTDFFIPW